jgi:hypothetical protein
VDFAFPNLSGTFRKAKSGFANPEASFANLKESFAKPKKTFRKPSSAFAKAKKSFANPEITFRNQSKTFRWADFVQVGRWQPGPPRISQAHGHPVRSSSFNTEERRLPTG